jgi:tetratricopeptide (TPR) repeat protein
MKQKLHSIVTATRGGISGKHKKKFLIGGILTLLVLLGAGSYFAFNKAQEAQNEKKYREDLAAYNQEYSTKLGEAQLQDMAGSAPAPTAEPEVRRDYYMMLADMQKQLGHTREALANLEKAKQLPGSETYTDLYDQLGAVYKQLGDKVQAKGAWQKALELLPGDKTIDDSAKGDIKKRIEDDIQKLY